MIHVACTTIYFAVPEVSETTSSTAAFRRGPVQGVHVVWEEEKKKVFHLHS